MPARVAAHCGRSRYATEPDAIGQRVPVPERNPRESDAGPKSAPKLEADIVTEQWLGSAPDPSLENLRRHQVVQRFPAAHDPHLSISDHQNFRAGHAVVIARHCQAVSAGRRHAENVA